MEIKRMGYVVFFQGKHVVDKLGNLPVHITYISKKQRYAIFYSDQKNEEQLKKQLRDVKGFKHMSPSPLFNEDLNYQDVK